jgi:hypothetical protein
MKETSNNYLEENAKVTKNNGTVSVRVVASKYENKHTDKLVWISTQDVEEWLRAKGHKIADVQESGFLRNKKENQDVTWVFNSKKKQAKVTKTLKKETDNDNVRESNKTKKV